jgi:triphosphoribosyl-dephospho-CoA synthase
LGFSDKAKHISQCLELAILLEAGAHKPGNVSVVTNFENTRYEHFLASAVAVGPSFEAAAKRGVEIWKGKVPVTDAGIGHVIKNSVTAVNAWQHGGNTLLGTIILLSPLAIAAGMMSTLVFTISDFRRQVRLVVESTTPQDAVDVYDAIRTADPAGLGKAPDLDLNDPASTRRILEERISLYQVFKIAQKYDTVCSEWVNNYPITFDVAYPTLTEQVKHKRDLNTAIIQTFLKILSEYPDTFIARKTGIKKAREVSLEAKEIMSLGGPATVEGRMRLDRFDRELRRQSNLLNPGTTADIVCAALALCVLGGYRP